MRLIAVALKRRFDRASSPGQRVGSDRPLWDRCARGRIRLSRRTILRRLEAQNSVREIAVFIDHEIAEDFGVSGVAGLLTFAAKGSGLYIERWPASENIPLPDPAPSKGPRDWNLRKALSPRTASASDRLCRPWQSECTSDSSGRESPKTPISLPSRRVASGRVRRLQTRAYAEGLSLFHRRGASGWFAIRRRTGR